MTDKRQSIASLKRQISMERARISNLDKRSNLQRELKRLKSFGKNNIGARIGRGFVILSKKVGGATLRQAQAMRERQIMEEKRTKKRRKGRSSMAFDNTFAPNF